MRDSLKIVFLILKLVFAGIIIVLGLARIVVCGIDALAVMKGPYRLEDSDLSQVKIRDHVTLDVTMSFGVASEYFTEGRKAATGEVVWRNSSESCYLVPLFSTDGNEINVDRILSVQVKPDLYDEFDKATLAFATWLDFTDEDAYVLSQGVHFNNYINNSKNLDMNNIPQNVVYHYDGILQELPDEILYADADVLRDYGLIEHLQRMYLVPAPRKDDAMWGVTTGFAMVLLAVILGIVAWRRSKV